LLLEIGYSQKNAIIAMLQQNKFEIMSINHDLAGHARIIMAKLFMERNT